MIARLTVLLLALFALPALAQPTPSRAGQQVTVVHAGHLLAEPGQPMAGPSTITIVDGRIESVTAGLTPPPEGARLIDLSDRTVLPGLIDTHVHLVGDSHAPFWRGAIDSDDYLTLLGAHNALTTLRAGFTTVRDLGSSGVTGFAIRRAIDEGLIEGPRILVAGEPLSIVGGHADTAGFRPEVNDALRGRNVCTGPIECAERVREQARNGADVIKFMATGGVLSQGDRGLGQAFTDEEMRAIVATAHSLGLKVAAHAHADEGIAAAVRAGVDSIEHGTFASEATLRLMREHGTALVPTLMAYQGIRERLGTGVYTPLVEDKVRMTLRVVGRAAREAMRLGVPVVFGTDEGVYEHGLNAGELNLLVTEAGMTPGQAIASATTGAARLLGLENEVGRIAPGYSADLIAVDGDPLADVRVLEHVRFVMARGHVVDGETR